MSNSNDYIAKVEVALKLDVNSVQIPYIPIGIYLQEAEELYHWCKDDCEKLTNAGLSEKVVENLPVLAGACREAQSIWMKELKTRKETDVKWSEESPGAFNFRDQLVHSFRYAFRSNNDLLSRLNDIAEGFCNGDMIQDLNDLAVLGKDNTELLVTIGFDMKLLDKAAIDSDYYADLLGQANGDKNSNNENKVMRDRMYTLLKKMVDEIRDCGKYVFWKDEKRLKGYRSPYLKQLNKAKCNSTNAVSTKNIDTEMLNWL